VKAGSNLVKLARDLQCDPPPVRYLKRSVLRKRALNLVCVENVIEAILYLANYGEPLQGQVFIVSDDEVPENNYGFVADKIARELGLPDSSLPAIPVPSALLSTALKLLGRPNVHSRQRYSSRKLQNLGFQNSMDSRQA